MVPQRIFVVANLAFFLTISREYKFLQAFVIFWYKPGLPERYCWNWNDQTLPRRRRQPWRIQIHHRSYPKEDPIHAPASLFFHSLTHFLSPSFSHGCNSFLSIALKQVFADSTFCTSPCWTVHKYSHFFLNRNDQYPTLTKALQL